ncbi:MAG: MBL fold metallo-hydrolase [Firmicutes bacterium]|nr:MBL fold metallo-hydrolase [Bacillota bacterium]
MLQLCTLSSSSKGNSIFIGSQKTSLLIDCGIPLGRLEKSLKVLGKRADNLNLTITHDHTDHTSGVGRLIEKYKAILKRDTQDFTVGDLLVSPFKVPHDIECYGFSVHHKNSKISVLTDLGEIENEALKRISDSDIVVIEANHDERLVQENRCYPYHLKKRILSSYGHLSNRDCAKACLYLVQSGVKQIILAHLSESNNYPELAFRTVVDYLYQHGVAEGEDVKIEVAGANRMSGLYEVKGNK